ncbi:hypothetical protein HDU76_010941 [Blyttiomyces sp. JEL0837]|nr:hypothetical protein HDU76_010941 [Blyttiomyces sp. JEL0837]
MADAAVTNDTKVFQQIDADQEVTEIESYCVNCEENGTTRLLLTVIPHFREVILMAFECPHCGFKNNEIQSGQAIQAFGSTQECAVKNKKDLNRQVVKSESASVKFVELDFEIPAATQRGVLTTIEGLISKAVGDISALQPQRKLIDEDVYNKIEAVIAKLNGYLENSEPFTMIIDDPAGNSYVENLFAPQPDPQIKVSYYKRTAEMNEALGLQPEQEEELDEDLTKDVYIFNGNCSRCNAPSNTRMHVLGETPVLRYIPHFKEVIIMATDCEACGYKSNEVKAGGAISERGKRIKLKVDSTEDLSRDILKSETCGLSIPEIDMELTPGTLGGRFTTVEGLLTQIHEELASRAPFATGDSADDQRRKAFDTFLGKLQKAINVEIPYTLIIDDPLNNSYLQNPYAPDEDPNMTIEE